MCDTNMELHTCFLLRKDVRRLLAAYTKDKGQAGLDLVFAQYTSGWAPDSTPSQEEIKRTAVDIGTDYIFLVSIQTAIKLHAANARWC